jgi:hypothetical protein
LESKTYFGRYGVANHEFIKDWLTVNYTTDLSAEDIADKRKTYCKTAPTTQVITVYYSQSGTDESPENYIISVEKYYPTNFIWSWNDILPTTAT